MEFRKLYRRRKSRLHNTNMVIIPLNLWILHGNQLKSRMYAKIVDILDANYVRVFINVGMLKSILGTTKRALFL